MVSGGSNPRWEEWTENRIWVKTEEKETDSFMVTKKVRKQKDAGLRTERERE